MFSKILGKKEKSNSEVSSKIAKMNLTDMRAYVRGADTTEDGLIEIMNKLLRRDANSKRYTEIGDNDSKIKKMFDVVILVAEHKKITVKAVEQIEEFINLYMDIIKKYDEDNKQIYSSKLKDAINKAINHVNAMAKLNKKLKVLGQ
jgi:hypothetical protein